MLIEFYLTEAERGGEKTLPKFICITNYIRIYCQQKLELMVLFQESLKELQ